MSGTHETISRIGDRRRARIGDQRDRRAAAHPLDQFRHAPLFVVLVITDGWRSNLVRSEHAPCATRVFACDQFDISKRLDRARRQITRISERRCNDVKHGAAARLFIDLSTH